MQMQQLPQVAGDWRDALNAAIVFASRAMEHNSVMMSSSTIKQLKAHVGDRFRGMHVAKIEAYTGGSRTRWNRASRYSGQPYDVGLGYTTAMVFTGADLRFMGNMEVIKQFGPQLMDAVNREIDRVLLSEAAGISDAKTAGRTNQQVRSGDYLDALFRIQAAADDSRSPVQITAPTAHVRDLVYEMTTTTTGAAIQVLQRPLTDYAQRAIRREPDMVFMGRPLKEARNTPKFGVDGYSFLFRKEGMLVVKAPVMSKVTVKDEFVGGGAQLDLVREWWGHLIPPHADENWVASVQGKMDIGGK